MVRRLNLRRRQVPRRNYRFRRARWPGERLPNGVKLRWSRRPKVPDAVRALGSHASTPTRAACSRTLNRASTISTSASGTSAQAVCPGYNGTLAPKMHRRRMAPNKMMLAGVPAMAVGIAEHVGNADHRHGVSSSQRRDKHRIRVRDGDLFGECPDPGTSGNAEAINPDRRY